MKQMNTEKAFMVIGKKLEKEYENLGFKYFKNIQFLRKRTKKFYYYIFFSPFLDRMPDTFTELWVTLMIHDRVLMRKNIYTNSNVVHMDLWEMGGPYNIANERLINDILIDLRNKIDSYLIPHIKRLEKCTPVHNDVI
jgi:hypothetical protein